MMIGFGVADNPQDRRKFGPHPLFDSLDGDVRYLHCNGWIDAAMIIDHESARRFAHADLVNVADPADGRRTPRERGRYRSESFRVDVNPGQHMWR